MTILAGVDEVGRGPLAGDVVAAAVILNEPIDGITDSKKLTALKREELAEAIKAKALCFAYGRASVQEIDELNIHYATLLAMKRAVEGLAIVPERILVDGKFVPSVCMAAEAIVDGDSQIYQISAASILAKVVRDFEMIEFDKIYPGYGFASHKGYATAAHLQALQELGACPIHRRSFRPVAELSGIKEDAVGAD